MKKNFLLNRYETWLFVLIVTWLACKVGALFGAPPAPSGPRPTQYALAAVEDRKPTKSRKSVKVRATRYYDVRQTSNGRWFAVVSDSGLYPDDVVWDVLDKLNNKQPLKAKKSGACTCSPLCTCGCQEGGSCGCGDRAPTLHERNSALLTDLLYQQVPTYQFPTYQAPTYQPTYQGGWGSAVRSFGGRAGGC